jgi:hypothetical protein
MSPEVSKHAGFILGHAVLTDLQNEERMGLISALQDAEVWEDIPDGPRGRLDELEAQIAQNGGPQYSPESHGQSGP